MSYDAKITRFMCNERNKFTKFATLNPFGQCEVKNGRNFKSSEVFKKTLVIEVQTPTEELEVEEIEEEVVSRTMGISQPVKYAPSMVMQLQCVTIGLIIAIWGHILKTVIQINKMVSFRDIHNKEDCKEVVSMDFKDTMVIRTIKHSSHKTRLLLHPSIVLIQLEIVLGMLTVVLPTM
ncbi:hypothetical protein Sjap_004023 [Stephania japonica]|uniref:Uncharacterized protein n=1 Tax=Stephania japonica TaxID=461633 RepID=A0AAP0K3N9_9MAGN